MRRTGIVGIGDMGSGLAKNLLAAGFACTGHDLKEDRLRAFADAGGRAAHGAAEVASHADAVFVMVMDGNEAKSVILGPDGLAAHLAPGSTVLLTATIKPAEAREIGEAMAGSGVHLVDSPVSGGYPGAQNGTLTMMAAGDPAVLDEVRPVMEAVSSSIHRVGTRAGDGQTVKACLQALIGGLFSATFEAAVLAAKSGVPGDVLREVVASSSAGCAIANGALEHIVERRFEGTGSGIRTMHKDLTISLDLAESLGVPMHVASAAMQLFHAGRARYPDGDNQAVARVIEEIVGAELHRGAPVARGRP